MGKGFYDLVAESFKDLTKTPNVFVARIEGDALYAAYLAAFPEGTNPIFRKNTEHDCSCCRHFIRRAGAVVSVDGATVRTVWDQAAENAPEPYRTVATALRNLVREVGIQDLFRVGANESSFGAQQSRSLDPETQGVVTWNHLYTGEIPRRLRVSMPDTVRGDYRTTVQVFERGLKELTPDAIETVLSLVKDNSLYRGEEHKPALLAFQQVQREYLGRLPREQALFVWENASSPAARFRNTVIGTLVQDLSDGVDLEKAVKSFETKVAPQNYKRTTSLITPAMVKKAMQTIEELGLESALERRFAVIGDISVNDVKWVDGSVRSLMKGGLGDVLMQHASQPNTSHAKDISLDDFMSQVLPEVSSMDLLFQNEHVGNLMSLTAPKNPEPKQLFRWSNDFAWSYGGNVADSIKERVKKAGGRVDDAVLRVSLSWFNYDDLDLHIIEPGGSRIYFSRKRGDTGGILDVDMNAGAGTTREAVENVVWTRQMPNGAYKIVVNNFSRRETSDVGFVVEVENANQISHFSYSKGLKQDVAVATLHMKGGVIERIEPGDTHVTAGNRSQEKWGLRTEKYVKVTAVTLSPNYWGENAVGNKHTFFVLDGAHNDEPTRGFYNEFLHPRLESHRKVFEVIGDKTKCQPTEGQLSGVGFSSTSKASLVIRATLGNKQRLFNVHV